MVHNLQLFIFAIHQYDYRRRMYVYWNYFENYVFLALIIEVRVRLNSNQTRTRMISGNRTRGSTRAITTNHSRTRLITITNHIVSLVRPTCRKIFSI